MVIFPSVYRIDPGDVSLIALKMMSALLSLEARDAAIESRSGHGPVTGERDTHGVIPGCSSHRGPPMGHHPILSNKPSILGSHEKSPHRVASEAATRVPAPKA